MYNPSVLVRSCTCPVCGLSVDQDIISHHVEQHFCNNQATSPETTTLHDAFVGQNQPEVVPPQNQVKHLQQVSLHSQQQQHRNKGLLQLAHEWDDSGVKSCTYNGCQDVVFASEWDDHVFAHMLEQQDDAELMLLASGQSNLHNGMQEPKSSSQSDRLNDSLLAQLTQHDLESTEITLHDDWLITKELDKDQNRPSDDEDLRQLQVICGMTNDGSYNVQLEKKLTKDVNQFKLSNSEYFSRKADVMQTLMTGHDSGESQTAGILARLRNGYQNGVTGIRSVHLCMDTDHYASSVGDAGWGCGYRNAQMLMSALLRSPKYRNNLIKGAFGNCQGLGGSEMLSIPKIQLLIETAWQNGFDGQGAEQLGRKLHNTSKWIGATEIAVLLRSFGIRARLVDFHQASGNDGTHPRMFTWMHQYYKAGQNNDEDLPPLFLQHQGHSRLCIGVEEHPRGECPIYLLLFDPSHAPRQMEALLQNMSTNMSAQLRLLRRSLKQMRSKQYQIVFIDGLMETDDEFTLGKTLESIRVP